VPGLGASFGRGAATSYQQDLANADCILIMGSNMAEAHPVGFRWPMKAKERGGTLLHVDPRFTRTSALCDLYVPIRAGTDVAFLGGLVNYVLSHDKWFHEYVLAYTNASVLIDEGFRDTEDQAGLFSGYHGSGMAGHYDAKEGHWGYAFDSDGEVPRDATLQHPRCVFQILKRHFARYTPEVVAEVCGCTPEQLIRVADELCKNSGRERTTTIVYSLGWTQHVTGVQIIRTAGILQLLLGNVGRPGGGIMAMRGHSTIQGSTDMATLYDSLPGYLPQPVADGRHDTLDSYVEHEGLSTGYWANFRKYIVSLLKAWYGDAATPENEFGFGWLPRPDGDYSHLAYADRMARGEVEGYFLFGQNPAGGGINAGLHRAGLRNLDWLVVLDWFETESAVFWKNDPTGPPPADIKTEVFFIPAAAAPEKEGSLTNTQRLIQWHGKALDPTGDSRSDAWFLYRLGKKLKPLYATSTDPRDRALQALTWDYDFEEPPRLPDGTISRIDDEPDLEKVLMEINGFTSDGRKQLGGFTELKDDGSTACGCWIYCGVFPEPGRNRAKERHLTENPLQPDWGFTWPDNRRVLYNRASADPDGKPWSERKKLVWWDDEAKRWIGHDRADFEPDKAPGYRPPADAKGMAAIAGDRPFIFKPDGMGWLFAPGAVKDGPLPTYYEPMESPVGNVLYPKQTSSPVVRTFDGPLNHLALAPETEYPVVATTFRLTEHYLSGPMSRFNSWLNELQPEMFVELSPELAAEKGITHGGWLTVETARGRIEARAMVTRRIQPLIVQGRVIHQIGLPFHWAFAGEVVGGNANDLTSIVADANVSMHDAKSFACRVTAGRSGDPQPTPTVPVVRWPIRGLVPETSTSAQPEGGSEHGR
jgi:formate dehydrogenase major subunit